MIGHPTVSLKVTPLPLAEALQFVVAMRPESPGQENAQHEIVAAIEQALDARRQRIIVSLAAVNPVKWGCLYLQAACALLVIGLVHHEDRLGAAIAMRLFATGVAASVLLIAAHDRPFAGQISMQPESLLQIMPADPGKS